MVDRINERVETLVRDWNITVEQTKETETSILAFGRRGDQPVVLKVLRNSGDEWHSGSVLKAFDDRGVVRVFDYAEGALLLERIVPGDSLVNLVLAGQDDAAIDILAGVIARRGSPEPPAGCIAVEDSSCSIRRLKR